MDYNEAVEAIMKLEELKGTFANMQENVRCMSRYETLFSLKGYVNAMSKEGLTEVSIELINADSKEKAGGEMLIFITQTLNQMRNDIFSKAIENVNKRIAEIAKDVKEDAEKVLKYCDKDKDKEVEELEVLKHCDEDEGE